MIQAKEGGVGEMEVVEVVRPWVYFEVQSTSVVDIECGIIIKLKRGRLQEEQGLGLNFVDIDFNMSNRNPVESVWGSQGILETGLGERGTCGSGQQVDSVES